MVKFTQFCNFGRAQRKYLCFQKFQPRHLRLEIFLTFLEYFGGIFQDLGIFETHFLLKIFLIKNVYYRLIDLLFERTNDYCQTLSRGGIP